MEEKNITKISLSTFFLILAIIAIIVMGIYIYKLNNDKSIEIQKSTELQAQVNSLNGTISDLHGKIATISNTINSNSTSTFTSNTSAISSTSSTSIVNTLKPSKKISKLIKNYEEAENLIFNGTKIDDFYENEISKDVGDAVWSGLKTEYKASSTHKKDTADYNVNNLDNLFTENCWCEGVSGTGIGEKIEVSAFASSEYVNTYAQLNKNRNDETIEDVEEYLLTKYNEQHKQANGYGGNYPAITKNNISNYSNEVNQIAIINGNAKTDELWKNNSRVKKLKLTIDDKVEYIFELEDSKDLQLFDINYKNDSITKKLNLKFEILEAYSGEKSQDTCLTSLYISGGTDIPWGGR